MRRPNGYFVALEVIHQDLGMLIHFSVSLMQAALFEKQIDRHFGRIEDYSVVTLFELRPWDQKLHCALVAPCVYLAVFLDCKAVVVASVDLADLFLVKVPNQLWPTVFLFALAFALTDSELPFQVVAPGKDTA